MARCADGPVPWLVRSGALADSNVFSRQHAAQLEFSTRVAHQRVARRAELRTQRLERDDDDRERRGFHPADAAVNADRAQALELEIDPGEICPRRYVDRNGLCQVGSSRKVGVGIAFFRLPIGCLQFDFPLLE